LGISNVYAQPQTNDFKIEGKINADTGSIKLAYIAADEFYPKGMHEMVEDY